MVLQWVVVGIVDGFEVVVIGGVVECGVIEYYCIVGVVQVFDVGVFFVIGQVLFLQFVVGVLVQCDEFIVVGVEEDYVVGCQQWVIVMYVQQWYVVLVINLVMVIGGFVQVVYVVVLGVYQYQVVDDYWCCDYFGFEVCGLVW